MSEIQKDFAYLDTGKRIKYTVGTSFLVGIITKITCGGINLDNVVATPPLLNNLDYCFIPFPLKGTLSADVD